MKKGILFIVITSVLIACSSKVNLPSDLKLIKSIKLAIPEPSGITVFDKYLYIVSDHNGTIYKCSLNGETIERIRTKQSDLEGITIDPISKNIIVINEAKRSLIYFNFDGILIKKQKIKGKQKNPNSGLEGICFDTSKNNMYVLNEKAPKQLLKLDENGKIIAKNNLSFSKDVSGICYDKKTNSLWVISDESKAIYNITKKGELLKSYKIPVEKAEGIVIYKNRIYVVSDDLKTLYVFEIAN